MENARSRIRRPSPRRVERQCVAPKGQSGSPTLSIVSSYAPSGETSAGGPFAFLCASVKSQDVDPVPLLAPGDDDLHAVRAPAHGEVVRARHGAVVLNGKRALEDLPPLPAQGEAAVRRAEGPVRLAHPVDRELVRPVRRNVRQDLRRRDLDPVPDPAGERGQAQRDRAHRSQASAQPPHAAPSPRAHLRTARAARAAARAARRGRSPAEPPPAVPQGRARARRRR